ncbi:uncharacterized protein LOC108628910 isoform X2 [Ceratina calcarata]|uniref:Uncharacterized protein LOC108628910 isoform X2 n=1 Tax=Ceratina calcarata TaxID=156304 RepID=A0AAJ7NB76_9HYME|nr:uncharacterized protein LOC108628910 isoform X2 [Ceratina calcarata]
MAQYYNIVTNVNGRLTLEEVEGVCSADGQSVQLVIKDENNGGGDNSQQFLTYATATVPQNSSSQALFSHQINLGGQISVTQLEQGQNVVLIKSNTNVSTSPSQEVLKTSAVNANTVESDIVHIVDNEGSKPLVGCNNAEELIRTIKMQENSITLNAVTKQGASLSEKTETATLVDNQNSPSPQNPLHGSCELLPLNPGTYLKRHLLRLHQNRSRFSTGSIQQQATSLDRVNVTNNIGSPQKANASNVRLSAQPSFCNSKTTGSPFGQNVTQISPYFQTSPNALHAKPPAANILSTNPQQDKKMETRLKQLQGPKNDQRTLKGPSQQQNSLHKQMSSSSQSQLHYQKQNIPQSPLSPPKDAMEIESPESPPPKNPAYQSPQTDSNNQCESVAYFQSMIHDPSTTKVQSQIHGNNAKMLALFSNGEKRLITFDIPNEDCTVQDLLEQANIVYYGKINVSLVSDPTLGINYIVEAGPGAVISQDMCDTDDSHDNSSSNLDAAHSSPDENINPVQQNEEPVYVEGKLAVCSHCGISSIDFNRCSRCKRKLPKDVKSIPLTMGTQEKKRSMISVDTFYKKNNERNSSAKLEKLERDGTVYKRGRGRGRGMSRPRPIHKEPECLTISSDDEEEGKSKKFDGSSNNSFGNDGSNSFNEEMETILEKEPVITNNSISGVSSSDYAMNNEDIKDNSLQAPHTSLLCRTVRIGSYKYIPRERIVISSTGIRFGVPLLEDDKTFVSLEVKIQDIVKVLVHFGKSMPVLFFYTSINTGAMIRELLGMQDPKGPYYDPAGKDNTHKRITLLPEKLSEEARAVLKSLFSSKRLLEELNSKEANDILVRASPKDSSQIQSLTRRESVTGSTNNSNSNGGIQTITVYPPPPAKGGIAINTEDYLCLGEDQFLNDVIIDFYLKYLTLEVLSESDQQRTHVFSSYFYKRLTSPHAQAAENNVQLLSPAAKRHARVQKWTKNVNIFEKDFIIIPINEHAHWFLAIICFPGLVGDVIISRNKRSDENDVRKTVQKSKKLKEVKLQAVTIGASTSVTTTITIDQSDDGSERDEAEGDDEEMEMDSDDDDESETAENMNSSKMEQDVPQNDTIKVPCILIFDSLAGASRARVVATLRDYLSCEYIAKMNSEKVFSKDTIKGASLKVPQQSNYTDCGLYVLQYVESFFKNPIKDYTLPIKTLKNWFEEIVVTRKREELSQLLVKLMNTTKGDKNITLPVVNFPTQDGKLKMKTESNVEKKADGDDNSKKKIISADTENRVSNNQSNQMESNDTSTEVIIRTTTYQIIPYSPSTSSNSSEGNSTEMSTESRTPQARSSSETMTYLKSKRIPRLALRAENQDEPQVAKKHKGEPFDSCK